MRKHYFHCLVGASLLAIIAGCATPNPKYILCDANGCGEPVEVKVTP